MVPKHLWDCYDMMALQQKWCYIMMLKGISAQNTMGKDGSEKDALMMNLLFSLFLH